jgi:hypothetical protein
MFNIDLNQFGLTAETYTITVQSGVQIKIPTGPLTSNPKEKTVGVLVLEWQQAAIDVYPVSQTWSLDTDNAPLLTVTFSSAVTRQCKVAVIRRA